MKNTFIPIILPVKKDLQTRLARSLIPILSVIIIGSVFSFCIYQFAISKGIPPKDLTRDPNSIAGLPFYIGGVTYLFIILWAAAASVCIMGAILLPKGSRKFWFLLLAGLYTTLLALDDAFQLHFLLFPSQAQTSEDIVYLLYLIYILSYLFYFLPIILTRTDFPILAVTLFIMAITMVSDIYSDNIFVNDILKLFGITFWLTYFSRTAVDFVNDNFKHVNNDTEMVE